MKNVLGESWDLVDSLFKMKLILCWLALGLSTSAVQARLGETMAECKVRYGEPVERKLAPNLDEMVLFKKDDFKYGVGLKNGKCVVLILGKVSNDPLTDEEVKILLIANDGGSIWKKRIKPAANEVWVREDNYAVAQLAPQGILTLVTSEYMKAELKKKAEGG